MERQLLDAQQGQSLMPANGQLPGSLELAFLGDTIYDLYVRGKVLGQGKVKKLHAAASGMVNAGAQSRAMDKVEGILTEPEQDVVRRARNAKQTPAKHADPRDYHRATALEALIGYLYIMGQTARIDELMHIALSDDTE